MNPPATRATGGGRAPELGWTSLLVPEADGGGSVSGHGLLDLTLVAEEMGRWVSPGPLLPTNVVAASLSTYGSGQRERYLPGLLSGETIATWCLGDAHSACRTALAHVRPTRAAEFVLSGTKGAVEAAAEAAFFLVPAVVDGALTQFLVDADTPGVTRGRGREPRSGPALRDVSVRRGV